MRRTVGLLFIAGLLLWFASGAFAPQVDVETGAAEGAGQILGPFTDITQRAASVVWQITSTNVPGDLHWRRILFIVFVASLIFFVRRGHGSKNAEGRERKTGLLNFLLPKDIYTHVSARVDIWLWILERSLRPLWAVSLFATIAPYTEQSVIASMQFVFGETPALQVSVAWMVLYSLVALLAYDLMFYAIHWCMHTYPALWAIHKVHHSAEVLTPWTRSREHFLAGPIWAAGSAFSYAMAAGVFAYLFNGGITRATILNVSVFSLLFGFNGAFRHYHVQFRYPRWLERWIQSPAMHHTHHSYARKHWNTNMAAVTSIYDRMFGTLYIPETDEHTPWGLGPGMQDEYRTFWQNTTGPFRDWYKMLAKRFGAPPTS